jgi:copper resistance protein D
VSGPEAALAACRFILAAAAMLLWGGAGYLGVLVPRALAEGIAARLRVVQGLAVLGVAAGVCAALPVQAARIGEGWPDALDPATLWAVLTRTRVGAAWLASAACALLVLAAQAGPRRHRQRATALAAGLVLASLAATGHAALHAGWLGLAHRANDVVHVLSGGAWLGALVPFVLVLRQHDGLLAGEAALALRRFSRAGHVAVALVLASGSLNTALVLGRLPTDLASPYQALLALKIGAVALMTVLALVNRYALVPRIARDRIRAGRSIRRLTVVEVGLGVAAVALVSVFGLLEPS